MNLLRLTFVACLGLLLASCDSGNIYPEDTQYDGISVTGNFMLLNPDAVPSSDYNFIFGVFDGESNLPLASVNIVRPTDGEMLSVRLDNIPAASVSVKLCLTNAGRRVVYTFFEYDIDGGSTIDITLPVAQIDMLKYSRIQKLIFEQYTCVSCHGTPPGTKNLSLIEGNSYSQLVGVPSVTRPDEYRVVPNDPDNSFLMTVLTGENVLRHSHAGYVTRHDDLDLLRIWIEAGCPNN